MNPTNTVEEILKEYDEKVNEVRRDDPQGNERDGTTHEFGYKTIRIYETGMPEVFVVTDFGNIRKFFAAKLQSLITEERERTTDLITKYQNEHNLKHTGTPSCHIRCHEAGKWTAASELKSMLTTPPSV